MSRKTVELRITASISDHHSEQDKLDRQAWDSLVRQVRAVTERMETNGHLSYVDVSEVR
jgi:hypothetical protein